MKVKPRQSNFMRVFGQPVLEYFSASSEHNLTLQIMISTSLNVKEMRVNKIFFIRFHVHMRKYKFLGSSLYPVVHFTPWNSSPSNTRPSFLLTQYIWMLTKVPIIDTVTISLVYDLS